MKNVKILLVFVAAVAMLSGCNKEYAVPTIAWEGGTLSNYVDNADDTSYDLDLTMTFGAEAGISEIVIWKHIYEGLDVTSVTLVAPTGYDALTTFEYNFVADNSAEDFTGGVTKIIYEFIVTDSELQTETAEYTIFNIDSYTVTFNVVDEAAVAITDATVTFDGTTNAAGTYVFNQIEAGTYGYTVVKEGYETVTVTDYVLADADATIEITLVESIAAVWSADIPLALVTETGWAVYNDVLIGTSESETIGFAFLYTDGSTFQVTKTTNCDGWVLIAEADVAGLTAASQLEAAYTDGTVIAEYDLPCTIAKAYEARYFVSKIGDTYKLVKYAYGYRNGADNTGNVVVFQYKD